MPESSADDCENTKNTAKPAKDLSYGWSLGLLNDNFKF
ncbi:hypothetical protein AL09_09400 [Corynebacterium diphtheriae bv. gravis str. ISS 4749]|nr:hypothetical protein AL09_09400 [Corynebacterium diphtheriae bv. gravis str. ISS 4749]